VNRSRRTSDRGPGPQRPSRRALVGSSDEQLVECVLGGNDEAFEVLFERHVADSLWYAREVLGSWGDAEEAVRHSFAAAHAYLETRGRETEFVPWLHTILGNHCLSMLQARAAGPTRHADHANVVDLGEWRLRRKLFGFALPIAPSAALRDSVMAACGIGAGAGAAATAGAPLLGGALANLAVVAVLAGAGVGVAGHVASDRAAAVDAGTRAPVEQAADVASLSSDEGGDSALSRQPAARFRSSPRAAVRGINVRQHESPRHDIPKRRAPRDLLQPKQLPGNAVPATPAGVPSGLATPTPAPVAVEAPAVAQPPLGSTVRRVVDVVKAALPATAVVTEVRLPDVDDPPRIGDDLGVTPTEPPVDAGALLTQGADDPPS
jgi:hypothetical protein